MHRFAVIRHEDQHIGQFTPRVSQLWLMALMMDQAADGEPIRIVIGKARKRGTSTKIQCLGVFLGAHFPNQHAVTIAHQAKSTDDIFDIARTCATRATVTDENILSEIHWPETGSRYYCQTAGATAALAGGTPSFLHQSEVAKWAQNKAETEYNSKIAVPDNALTCVFQESTFVGRDLFWDRFQAASRREGTYRALFLPWWLDGDCTGADVPASFTLTPDERIIVERGAAIGVAVSNGSLQWRRDKIADLGPHVFRQEYPSTPEEAVQAQVGLVVPGLGEAVIDDVPFILDRLPDDERRGGIDFGYHDATVIITAVWRDGVLWIIAVYRSVAGIAADWVAGCRGGHRYSCDPSDLHARHELSAAANKVGLRCYFGPAKSMDDSNAEWKALANFVRQGRLRIVRSATSQLLFEADNFVWDEVKGVPKKIRDTHRVDGASGQSFGHFDSLDALRHMVISVLAETGPAISSTENMRDRQHLNRREQLRRW